MNSNDGKPIEQAGSNPLLSGSPITPGMHDQYRVGDSPKKLWPYMVGIMVVVLVVLTVILVSS